MNSKAEFNFVDLYAGIGGFRIALEKLGGKCLGFSEIDKHAIQVYKQNFRKNTDEIELGTIENLEKLPFNNIDLIVGGVPCQAWSVAGKMRGFEDPRGKLWFDTIRVVRINQPKAFIFENVKGLADPRNKKSLDYLIEELENVGYNLTFRILNSFDFGLPQNRERILIVGFRKDIKLDSEFTFPNSLNKKIQLHQFLETQLDSTKMNSEKKKFSITELFGERVPPSRNKLQKNNELNDFFVFCDTRDGHSTIHSWDIIETSEFEKKICLTILKNRRKKIYGQSDGNPIPYVELKKLIKEIKLTDLKKLVEKGILREVKPKGFEFVNSKNSSGINNIYRIYLPTAKAFSTLTATGTKDLISTIDISTENVSDYKNVFIEQVFKKGNYRELTSRESANLQGFPNNFILHNDDRIAKKQLGNAVSTNVIYHLAKNIIKSGFLNNISNDKRRKNRSTTKV